MKDLRILSEITTRYGNRNINELEFKTPEDFAAYKKKHKMRPGTVVKVAGKDKVVDEPKGKKSKSKPMSQPSDKPKDKPKAEPKKSKDFNGVDYEKMKGKEPGVWDRQAVNNLSASNPEIVKQLGLTGDNEKDSPILKKLDLAQISDIIDKYGDDYDKESHMERLKDDHGLGDKPDIDPKTDKEMQKVASDANEKMAKAEFSDTLDSDPMYAGELYSKNLKNIPEEDREMGQEALFALQDVEMGLLKASDAEWAKEFLRKDILPHIKEGKDFDLRQLSKITTRYTNRLDEASKVRGANNKMVEVPKSYTDKTGKFAYRFYKTSGMGGDLTSDVKLGYQRYHKIPPNDEFSGSVILKKDAMDIKKKDINLVMKNLKSVAKQNGINIYIMKYVPDRNEPFIEFKMRNQY